MIDALLTKRHAGLPAWGSPLWLVLAVEELNLLEPHDFACMQREYTDASAERLQSLMLDVVGVMPTDIFRLYRATFDRAAELLGTAVVAALIGLIAASRAGWRESEKLLWSDLNGYQAVGLLHDRATFDGVDSYEARHGAVDRRGENL